MERYQLMRKMEPAEPAEYLEERDIDVSNDVCRECKKVHDGCPVESEGTECLIPEDQEVSVWLHQEVGEND